MHQEGLYAQPPQALISSRNHLRRRRRRLKRNKPRRHRPIHTHARRKLTNTRKIRHERAVPVPVPSTITDGPGVRSVSSEDGAREEQRGGGHPLDVVPVHGVQRHQGAHAHDVAGVADDQRALRRVPRDPPPVLQRLRVPERHHPGDACLHFGC